MADYGKGKIYKIIVKDITDGYEPYIGSTTKEYLSQRFVHHRKDYSKYKNGACKFVSSFALFDKYGIENCEIVLIENYPCTTKDELRARERHWFDEIKNCNKIRPIRTEEEIEHRGKEYYNNIKQLNPNHGKDNYKKALELHPDLNKTQYQRKLELHPDLNEKRKEKYTCECGTIYRKDGKTRHEKSKKHCEYIALQAIKLN
jgi:hypothetical protein